MKDRKQPTALRDRRPHTIQQGRRKFCVRFAFLLTPDQADQLSDVAFIIQRPVAEVLRHLIDQLRLEDLPQAWRAQIEDARTRVATVERVERSLRRDRL